MNNLVQSKNLTFLCQLHTRTVNLDYSVAYFLVCWGISRLTFLACSSILYTPPCAGYLDCGYVFNFKDDKRKLADNSQFQCTCHAPLNRARVSDVTITPWTEELQLQFAITASFQSKIYFELTIFELPQASVSKRGEVRSHSYENDFSFSCI